SKKVLPLLMLLRLGPVDSSRATVTVFRLLLRSAAIQSPGTARFDLPLKMNRWGP
ncbi:MAG: hypothetical protein ACI8PQ_002360, partial [Planctomycetota bacterium]